MVIKKMKGKNINPKFYSHTRLKKIYKGFCKFAYLTKKVFDHRKSALIDELQ